MSTTKKTVKKTVKKEMVTISIAGKGIDIISEISKTDLIKLGRLFKLLSEIDLQLSEPTFIKNVCSSDIIKAISIPVKL